MASTGTRRFNRDALLMARLRLGKTQREVAIACTQAGYAIDDSNISKYERGVVAPVPGALPVLAKVLQIEVDDLFERTGDAA